MNIADLFFGARLEDGKLQIDAKKSGDKAGQTLGASMAGGIKKQGGALKQGFVQGLGIGGALGVAGLAASAISGVTNAMFDSIDAASDLNETISKSNTIFGENAAEISAWADNSAREFGQSKRAALDVASTFAGLFSTVGLTLDDATDKAKALTVLGSDLASFFNTDVATATQALRSGLSGESEPLRQFNVFLSETAVAAKAAQLGLQKTNGAFTEGQKVTARYALIMDQTGAAQGDFAKTSGGLAGSQKILSAAWEDASAKLGQALLPLVTEFVHFVTDVGVPTILGFADAIGQLAGAFDPLFRGIEIVSDGLSGKLTPALIEYAWNAGLVEEISGKVREQIHDLSLETLQAAREVGIFTDAEFEAERALRGASGAADAAASSFGKMEAALAEGEAMFGGLSDGLTDAYGEMLAITGVVGSVLAAQGKAQGRRAGEALADGIRSARDDVDSAWADFLTAITTVETPAKRAARLLGRLASKELAAGLNDERPEVRLRAEAIFQTTIDELGQIQAEGGKIGKVGMQRLAEAMRSKNPAVASAARLIYNSASKVAPPKSKAFQWGSAIGQGLVNGLNAQATAVGAAAGNLAQTIANYLATGSPSKLGPLSIPGGPETWGRLVGAGFSKGLSRTLPNLSDALGSSLRMPSMSLGSAVPSMALAGYGGASVSTSHVGGVTNNYYNTANVTGLVKATDPLEIARQLGRSARSGDFRPKP